MPVAPLVLTVLVITVTADATGGELFGPGAVPASGSGPDLVESAPLAFAFDPGLTAALMGAMLPQDEG